MRCRSLCNAAWLWDDSETDEGGKCVGGVPYPGVAVIPVLVAADPLGERRRRRGGDRARRGKQQQLQDKGAPADHLEVGSVVAQAPCPCLPGLVCHFEALIEIGDLRNAERLVLVGDDSDERMFASGDVDLRHHRAILLPERPHRSTPQKQA